MQGVDTALLSLCHGNNTKPNCPPILPVNLHLFCFPFSPLSLSGMYCQLSRGAFKSLPASFTSPWNQLHYAGPFSVPPYRGKDGPELGTPPRTPVIQGFQPLKLPPAAQEVSSDAVKTFFFFFFFLGKSETHHSVTRFLSIYLLRQDTCLGIVWAFTSAMALCCALALGLSPGHSWPSEH